MVSFFWKFNVSFSMYFFFASKFLSPCGVVLIHIRIIFWIGLGNLDVRLFNSLQAGVGFKIWNDEM